MKIGGFKVGEYVLKEKGNRRNLIFDCKNCIYGANISSDARCRFHCLAVLGKEQADSLVLSEVYERIYNESQTEMLKQVANLQQKFMIENPWSYSHLSGEGDACKEVISARHDVVVRIAHDLLSYDPVGAYITLLKEENAEKLKMESASREYINCTQRYIETLSYMRGKFEELNLIKKTKKILQETDVKDTADVYKTLFEVEVKPSFLGSRLSFEGMENFELMDEYYVKNTTVQIFKSPDKIENFYFINPPEYSLSPDKYFIMSKTKEIVANYKPGKTSLSTVASSREYFERVYESTIKDLAKQNNVQMNGEEIDSLAEIVARYTVGYSVLEILLNDRKITDIYVDAPIGEKPLYVIHSDYGQCQTNIYYNNEEAESMLSKLRAMSGRPFDEAHPVLDYDLPEFETRVAAIGPPLSPDGTAFAFRLHKKTPWTMPQFIDKDFLNPFAAGLISFLIDNQATTIITGSRGSGKTSLMGAAMIEITMNSRILVQEDTMEIPVPYLKKIGFNIQRMKTRSPLQVSRSETEVAPEEALRTALRLGDSAIILGEVRSVEAKVLYEAMRVGAAGNIVMGTIHGDSAYSVWDRVVNDLGVPTTSFKATDLVVVARPIRFGGSLKRHRRVVQITEVKKHWEHDPDREGGLLDLMTYNAKTDTLELNKENVKNSDLLNKIANLSGLTRDEIWEDIKTRGTAKKILVDYKRQYDIPLLLEGENYIIAHNKLLLLREESLEENGKPNYTEVLEKWQTWVKESLVKRLVKQKED